MKIKVKGTKKQYIRDLSNIKKKLYKGDTERDISKRISKKKQFKQYIRVLEHNLSLEQSRNKDLMQWIREIEDELNKNHSYIAKLEEELKTFRGEDYIFVE